MELIVLVGLLFVSGSTLAAAVRQSGDGNRYKPAGFKGSAMTAAVMAVLGAAGSLLREAAVQEAYFSYYTLAEGLLVIWLQAFLLAQAERRKAA
jgi:hypothetical protein